MDIDASRMDDEWNQRPDEVLRYCVMDTILPIEILEAIHAIRARRRGFSSYAVPTCCRWNHKSMDRFSDG